MIGFALLLLFNLVGVVLSTYGHVPLPGNVIGLLLLLAALAAGIVKLHWIEETSHLLLRHMLLFFAPLVVGSLGLLRLFAGSIAAIAAVIVVSTLLTALVTAVVANFFKTDHIRPDSP